MADYEDTKVKDLVINNMSQEKFDELKAAGELQPDQIYFTPTEESGGSSLPDQTDNAGKFLTTDGTTASWSDKPLVNKASSTRDLAILGRVGNNTQYNTVIGYGATSYGGDYNTVVGADSQCRNSSTLIGARIQNSSAKNAVIVGSGNNDSGYPVSVEDNSFTWVLSNTEYKLFSADGTMPAERISATAGTTGQVLTKTDTGMEWQDATGGELPDNVLVNNSNDEGGLAIGKNSSAGLGMVAVGPSASADTTGTAIGYGATTISQRGVAIGYKTKTRGSRAIQLGTDASNEDDDTFKVANINGNFEMMSVDGTIPTDRYTTTPTTAGTYVPKLTIAEDGTATREWGTESDGDYLPLSGGTLTGDLTISDRYLLSFNGKCAFKSGSDSSGRVIFGDISAGFFNEKIIFSVTGYGALLPANNQVTLGGSSNIWKKTYTTIINNGADLAVPTEGGTLARLEDLEGLGGLPDQTDNAGKFLTTDGTTASWSDRALVNVAPAYMHTTIMVTNSATSASTPKSYSVVMGRFAETTAENTLALGYGAVTKAEGAIQLNASNQSHTNSDPQTFKVANKNGNFELMSADGTIPTDRYTTTPTDAGTYVPKLTIAEDGTATREWGTESGGASLPDQTDNAGKFLTTDGTTASWSDKPLVNNSTATKSLAVGSNSAALGDDSVAIGYYASLSTSKRSVAVGYNSGSVGQDAVSIGYQTKAIASHSIQLGSLGENKIAQNIDANTFKVANSNGNFEMMDANGNVPLERLTYVTDQIGDISTALTAILGE